MIKILDSFSLVDKLEQNSVLTADEYEYLISDQTEPLSQYLFEKARKVRERFYGKDVYIRGLIEFSNYCKNDCLYCGIRRSNLNVQRYRLSPEDILACCKEGYDLGFRTFVLQSGEDGYYTDDRLIDIISSVKNKFPDCALTLSIGEKTFDQYKSYFEAGADRYLLRHETADNEHYSKLHPKELSLENRKKCLWDLKKIGYQVGTGFMVGSPYQTPRNLSEDMLFLKDLQPDMVGIGPFISHKDTPFSDKCSGTMEQTLFMIGLIRLTLPDALIPATTALGTINPMGREKGILAGANVTMPNLSPMSVRKKYMLYDNKICTGDESAQCRDCLERRINSIGYNIVVNRGDRVSLNNK